MFNTYEFIFAGEPSSMHGLYICDFGSTKNSDSAFGNKAEIIETRIPGRVRPIHSGVNYNATPLSFKLIFGSDQPLDRWQMQEISMWLTGYQQYQWLSIEQPDLAHLQYHCLIRNLEPISVGWLPYAFQADIRCDCPYAYSYPISQTFQFKDGDEIRFFNGSTTREKWKPNFNILPTNCNTIVIENTSDFGRKFELTKFPASDAKIFVDNENCVLYDEVNGVDLYEGFNDEWMSFVPGDNILKMTGNGTLTISGRFFYNVGA